MTGEQLILSDDQVVTFGELRLMDLAASYDENNTANTVTRIAAKICYVDGELVGEEWLLKLSDEDAARVVQKIGDATTQLAMRVNPMASSNDDTQDNGRRH